MSQGSTSEARHDSASAPLPDGTVAQLRLLGTTDLHAHLMAYDYYADEGDRPYGLVRIATAIRSARAEAVNTLLFDNGDALQGTPIGDLTTCPNGCWTGPSPVIAAMNQLGYDAASLGNHEFNFGLDWLAGTLRRAQFPFTCANVDAPCARDGTSAAWPVARHLILEREVTCEDGTRRPLSIGVVGLVPPQITMWDHIHLAGRLEAHDMVAAAREAVPRLRVEGADIVILLAHSGIDPDAPDAMAENAALTLARIDGVDAIMTGHSHGLFPQPGGAEAGNPGGVDHTRGLLAGTPALMAGACGGHLGVLDLTLTVKNGRWHSRARHAELRGVAAVPPDAPLEAALGPAHDMTLRHMRRPIGTSQMRLHSYLALARPDPSVAALNAVQTRLMQRALTGTVHEGLPILSATPPFKTGGRGGPRNFTDLPKGTLSYRHAANLYPFPNRLCGLLITGAGLRDWLERAAICFATIVPGAPDQMLRDMEVPGHDFDVISGLTYEIDLSAPPMFTRMGTLLRSGGGRIRALAYQGRPVADKDRFVLATNTYRAFGAGAFGPTPQERIVHISPSLLRQDLIEDIARTPLAPPPDYHLNWRFVPMPGTTVLLDTGLPLRNDRAALKSTGAEDIGETQGGFLRLRLPL